MFNPFHCRPLHAATLTLPIAMLATNLQITPATAAALVENGAPRATIVVAQSALDPAKDNASAQKVNVAAKDLQEYVRKISGATLPLQGDESTPAGALILVGKSRLTDAMKIDLPSGLTPARKEEGFVIQSRGNNLVLAGNDAGPYHGTEYAVYDFLNRLGVRWFMPGEFGEYIPAQKAISTGEYSVREKPDFIQRNWWLHATPEMAGLERRWKIRNKMNPDNMFTIPQDSSLRGFVADAELAKTKPELFAKNFDGSLNLHYPNLSNPETVKIAAEKAKELFRKNPNLDSVGMAPDDGMPRDFNPETVIRNAGFSDLVGREGVPAEMSSTEEWIEWVNAVTREVNKEFPDKIITTNGYANRNMAPFGVAIDPHVSIMFAAIWSDTLHSYDNPRSWQMNRQGDLLRQWCRLNDKVWIYGYDYTMLISGLAPVPMVRKFAHDMPLLKKWGVMGFIDEARNAWAERGPATKYIKARLEWDADANVADLMKDLFSKWYGAAEKPSRAFWDTLESTMESTPVLGHEDRVLPYVYSPQLLVTLQNHLTEAERLASTPREKQHVQIDRLIFEHLRSYVQMHDAEFAGNFSAASQAATRMLVLRRKLSAINPFLMPAEEKDPQGNHDYNSGLLYWTAGDRAKYYQKLSDMTTGKTGDLVTLFPEHAAFTLDPEDKGRFVEWYQEKLSTQDWKDISTTQPFYLQGYMSKDGYPYLGQMWYRFNVNVPASAAGKRVLLYAPNLETEAWAWVNGKYVGHRPYRESYIRPNDMELDVTDALRPGKSNNVSIRVSTSMNRTAVAGGLLSRLFFYSPKK
jgi:hypothetical protein